MLMTWDHIRKTYFSKINNFVLCEPNRIAQMTSESLEWDKFFGDFQNFRIARYQIK